jgi:hypothetical protein
VASIWASVLAFACSTDRRTRPKRSSFPGGIEAVLEQVGGLPKLMIYEDGRFGLDCLDVFFSGL